MGDYAADTLRDTIESAWSLTGRLSKTAAADMKNVVKFFAREQIAGNEYVKAVEVKKINSLEKQIEFETPNFAEVQDRFEITCRYRLKGANEVKFNEAEADIEDMAEEMRRIVKTVYSPSQGNGSYHKSSWIWENKDTPNSSKPELVRMAVITLIKVKSQSDEVFVGLTGVLLLDVSATTADSKPGSDYIYTEAEGVEIHQGYETIPELIQGSDNPAFYTGGFLGEFSCTIYAKKSDVNSSTIEALDNIYRLQSSISGNIGEHASVTFLYSTDNTEGTPVTLDESIPLIITNISRISPIQHLVRYEITARITSPTTYTVA